VKPSEDGEEDHGSLMRTVAYIAKHLPGVGDPMALRVDEADALLHELAAMLKPAPAKHDHRAIVEAQMEAFR
jgi:hypothetical protein